LGGLRADRVDLVGHSMGGLVIVKLFERAPLIRPGRIVLLGSPLHGSRAASGFARVPFGKAVLGRGIAEGVLEETAWPRRWSAARPLGIIAGRAGVGLGRLLTRFEGPNDGVVAVDETRLEGASEHLVLDVNHAGMLFSRAAFAQTAAFLEHGCFIRDRGASTDR
ncbi:MAG: alpha/beta hydrolase, partial [Steroidobacteraceae bacterium]|nr:alpha/beta hydrolase [Steroidobacteraceae bacterium]